MKLFSVENVQKLTESVSLYLGRDVLSIIHEYISIAFDLPFLEAALPFFDSSEPFAANSKLLKQYEEENKSFCTYPLDKDECFQYLLLDHVVSSDIDILVIRGCEDTVYHEGSFLIRDISSSVGMFTPIGGFTIYHIFKTLQKYINRFSKRCSICNNNGILEDESIKIGNTKCIIDESGMRVMILYIIECGNTPSMF